MRSCVFALLMLAAVVSAGVVDILKGASRPDPRKASLRAKANGAPMLSKSYQVQANLMITVDDQTLNGTIQIASDYKHGKMRSDSYIGMYGSEQLYRYDLHRFFNIHGTTCNESALAGAMPDPWAGLKFAAMIGQETYNGVTANVWEYTGKDGSVNQVAVLAQQPTIPAWLVYYTDSVSELLFITKWSDVAPDSSFFNVPSYC